MRIPYAVYENIVYIYDQGRPVGTGFCVGIPVEPGSRTVWNYVVTARHVVRHRSGVSIRINGLSGNAVELNAHPDTWFEADDPHVDAALAFFPHAPELFSPTVLRPDQIADNDFLIDRNVGPGDEVMTVGLLPQFPGKDRNLPIARFGHIAAAQIDLVPSMGPGNILERLDVVMVEGFSWGGQSGSPVYVLFPPTRWMGEIESFDKGDPRAGWALLGLMSGHWRIPQSIKLEGVEAIDPYQEPTGVYNANAAISLVTLGQHILDLLNREDVVADRQRRIQKEKADEVTAVQDSSRGCTEHG